MAYSKFQNLKKVIGQFDLKVDEATFFQNCNPIAPAEWLLTSIEMAREEGYNTEKERSERVVYPVLRALSKRNQHRIIIYSGHELDVDASRGLNGEIDFLLSWGKVRQIIQTPIFSVVEAKKQDLDFGTAQCVAQMVGVQLFNEEQKTPVKTVYGCSTTGDIWRFFKLEKHRLTFHSVEFFLTELPEILGFMQCIFDEFRAENGLD